MFGAPRAASTPVPENHILLVPSEDRWNDFGYRTKVDVYVNVGGTHWGGLAHVGFLTNASEEQADVDRINQWLASTSELTIAATESIPFFTMLPSMKSYRDIVLVYGPDRAVRILRAIRDLVVLRELPSNANWLDLAIQSQVFLKSFVRTSESFFAFHNAGPVLRGLEQEESGRLSRSLGITFRLPGRESDHDLQFHFDHQGTLPKRIAIVIGKNGVGKSQTLGRIATAALTGDSALTDMDTQGRPLINRLLAFAPTNEAKSVFPTDRRRRPRIWYRRFSLNRSERLTLGDGVAGIIVQVARSVEHIRNMSRWDIFLNAIEAIHRGDEIHLPSIHGHYLPLRALHSGGERTSLENFGFVDRRKDPVRVLDGKGYPLSSGEISFLRFAAQASLHIENGSLLLLDEPETHLHPNFISQLVLLLDNLLKLTGSAAIIATHSVYFVREVFPAQVTVLRVDEDGAVLAEQPRLRTFGADVGAISYFVFGEDEPSRLAARVEERLLSRFTSWEELYSQYKDELSIEVLGALREALEARASK
jgi:ABC-type branched-subunit amino acid transport system ATPase component